MTKYGIEKGFVRLRAKAFIGLPSELHLRIAEKARSRRPRSAPFNTAAHLTGLARKAGA